MYQAHGITRADNHVTRSARSVAAKQPERPPLGLALSVKRSFDSGEKESQANLVVTSFLR